MNIDSKINQTITRLREKKRRSRERIRAMSPTDKIRQLELLQARYYELLTIREASQGKAIPADWEKWANAQRDLDQTHS